MDKEKNENIPRLLEAEIEKHFPKKVMDYDMRRGNGLILTFNLESDGYQVLISKGGGFGTYDFSGSSFKYFLTDSKLTTSVLDELIKNFEASHFLINNFQYTPERISIDFKPAIYEPNLRYSVNFMGIEINSYSKEENLLEEFLDYFTASYPDVLKNLPGVKALIKEYRQSLQNERIALMDKKAILTAMQKLELEELQWLFEDISYDRFLDVTEEKETISATELLKRSLTKK